MINKKLHGNIISSPDNQCQHCSGSNLWYRWLYRDGVSSRLVDQLCIAPQTYKGSEDSVGRKRQIISMLLI